MTAKVMFCCSVCPGIFPVLQSHIELSQPCYLHINTHTYTHTRAHNNKPKQTHVATKYWHVSALHSRSILHVLIPTKASLSCWVLAVAVCLTIMYSTLEFLTMLILTEQVTSSTSTTQPKMWRQRFKVRFTCNDETFASVPTLRSCQTLKVIFTRNV